MPKLFLTVFLGVLSSSCATADTDLNKILTAANDVVNNATKVEVAKLKPAAAESVMKNALNAPNTIAKSAKRNKRIRFKPAIIKRETETK